MILQALYEYAQRKGDALPEDGFEDVEIKYLIKIREDGSFVDLVSTGEPDGKGKTRWHEYKKLPLVKHTNSLKAYLLLDNFGYVLLDERKRSAFIMELEKAKAKIPDNIGLNAVLSFYKENKSNGLDSFFESDFYKENDLDKLSSTLVTFELINSNNLIVQNQAIINYYRELLVSDSSENNEKSNSIVTSICLITGEEDSIARTHVKLSGICEKQTSFVSFNKDSFLSYGKKQSYNAPVSIKANYGYTKALNYLVNKSQKNKSHLGKDTVVFWAEKKEAEPFEDIFYSSLFSGKNEDNPDEDVHEVKNLFDAVNTGKFDADFSSNFYVLCLSPNAARISVRFWETGKVETFAKRIKQHFDDFEITRPKDSVEHLNLYQILSATALEHKMDNVAPNLIGNVTQSILKGLPYPATLQQQCIRRIRAEQEVSRERAAILKAYINRINRMKDIKEVSVALDRNEKNKGYLLGRLFAVFEKVQQDTHPGLKATIVDRFYGAASTNPRTVFAQLSRLNRHHLSSYDNAAFRVNREKEIGEIMNLIDSFPAHLDLNEQSYFAIGYYHEKQSFFEKTNKSEETEGDN